MSKVQKLGVWVLHVLSNDNINQCVSISDSLLAYHRLACRPFLSQFVTVNIKEWLSPNRKGIFREKTGTHPPFILLVGQKNRRLQWTSSKYCNYHCWDLSPTPGKYHRADITKMTIQEEGYFPSILFSRSWSIRFPYFPLSIEQPLTNHCYFQIIYAVHYQVTFY